MIDSLSLIVLPFSSPSNVNEFQLRYYVEQDSLWKEYTTSTINLQQKSSEIDQTLSSEMTSFEDSPATFKLTQLRTLGTTLFSDLLPTDLQTYLKQLVAQEATDQSPVLRIHMIDSNKIDWIPWELMFVNPREINPDAQPTFLGVHFQVARLPIQIGRLGSAPPQLRKVRHVINFLGRGVLKGAELNDWKDTFTPFLSNKEQEWRRPASDNNSDYPGWHNLDPEEENLPIPDILHVTCHGITEQNKPFYWTLDDSTTETNYQLSQRTIKLISDDLVFATNQPMIFGNACASAGIGVNGYGRLMAGFGAEFYRLGASAFVGTFAPISKKLAVEFARQFYQQLFANGQPIGEALRATKQHFKEQGGSDPSWLFYCLYGSPTTKYEWDV